MALFLGDENADLAERRLLVFDPRWQADVGDPFSSVTVYLQERIKLGEPHSGIAASLGERGADGLGLVLEMLGDVEAFCFVDEIPQATDRHRSL